MILQHLTPTALADTILEIPRSDVRLFCADDLASSPIEYHKNAVPTVQPSLAAALPPPQNPHSVKPITSLNADYMLEIINNYRSSIGLVSFQKDQAICDIAKQRGPELDYEVETGTIHAGFRERNLPYWATENMKYGGNEQEMLNWWLNSSIHRSAIEGDYAYSCGECYGNSCVQLFTNYQPK